SLVNGAILYNFLLARHPGSTDNRVRTRTSAGASASETDSGRPRRGTARQLSQPEGSPRNSAHWERTEPHVVQPMARGADGGVRRSNPSASASAAGPGPLPLRRSELYRGQGASHPVAVSVEWTDARLCPRTFPFLSLRLLAFRSDDGLLCPTTTLARGTAGRSSFDPRGAAATDAGSGCGPAGGTAPSRPTRGEVPPPGAGEP